MAYPFLDPEKYAPSRDDAWDAAIRAMMRIQSWSASTEYRNASPTLWEQIYSIKSIGNDPVILVELHEELSKHSFDRVAEGAAGRSGIPANAMSLPGNVRVETYTERYVVIKAGDVFKKVHVLDWNGHMDGDFFDVFWGIHHKDLVSQEKNLIKLLDGI